MNKPINIHATNTENEALLQFDKCCKEDFVLSAALMPDAHTGYVAPIGSVIKTKSAIVPAWVGYDIGCGMIAIQISDQQKDQDNIRAKGHTLFDQVNTTVPMGVGGSNRNKDRVYLTERMKIMLEELESKTLLKNLFAEVKEKSRPHLGTLGSGNHFIEILTYEAETWLVIHSGSRGVGYHIGTYFMKEASGLSKGYEATYALKDENSKREYMLYQNYALEFALLNRLSIAMKVQEAVSNVTAIEYDTYKQLWTNKNHNHCIEVETDIYLHRKGATSSDKGELGVIPANMKDGCFLVEGLGNEDFLNSSSHGAGRKMSRTKARLNVTLEQFEAKMQGIIAPVNKRTIDESPFAYKDIIEVMSLQKDSVKTLKHLLPIINWKGY